MQFKIQDVESEKFYRFRGGRGRLKMVPGSEKKAVRIYLACDTREGSVVVWVRSPTRSKAVSVVKELLGISDARWATMLRQYQEKKRRDAAREEIHVARIRRRNLAKFERRVAAMRKRVKS